MLVLVCALLILYAWWAPASLLGRSIQRLIETQLSRWSAIRPFTVVLFIAMTVLLGGLVAYGKIDGLLMALPAAGEGFALFASIDVGLAVEVLTTGWLLACRGGVRAAMGRLRSMLPPRLLGRPRRPARFRARRDHRPPSPPANDDDPAAAWAFGVAKAA